MVPDMSNIAALPAVARDDSEGPRGDALRMGEATAERAPSPFFISTERNSLKPVRADPRARSFQACFSAFFIARHRATSAAKRFLLSTCLSVFGSRGTTWDRTQWVPFLV